MTSGVETGRKNVALQSTPRSPKSLTSGSKLFFLFLIEIAECWSQCTVCCNLGPEAQSRDQIARIACMLIFDKHLADCSSLRPQLPLPPSSHRSLHMVGCTASPPAFSLLTPATGGCQPRRGLRKNDRREWSGRREESLIEHHTKLREAPSTVQTFISFDEVKRKRLWTSESVTCWSPLLVYL